MLRRANALKLTVDGKGEAVARVILLLSGRAFGQYRYRFIVERFFIS